MITNRYSINLVASRSIQNLCDCFVICHCAFDNSTISTHNILARKHVCCFCSDTSYILECRRNCGDCNLTKNLARGWSNILCFLCRCCRFLFKSYCNSTFAIVYAGRYSISLVVRSSIKRLCNCTIICKSTSRSRTIRLDKDLVCADVSFLNSNSTYILIIFGYSLNCYRRKTIITCIGNY